MTVKEKYIIKTKIWLILPNPPSIFCSSALEEKTSMVMIQGLHSLIHGIYHIRKLETATWKKVYGNRRASDHPDTSPNLMKKTGLLSVKFNSNLKHGRLTINQVYIF